MTRAETNKKASAIVKWMPTGELLELYLMTMKPTSDNRKAMDQATVRNWVLDELADRHPAEYKKYVNRPFFGKPEDIKKYFKA